MPASLRKRHEGNLDFTRACVLGDGNLHLTKRGHIQLSINHSPRQLDYLYYKAKRIGEELGRKVNVTGPKNIYDDRTGKTYIQHSICTTATKELESHYQAIYLENKKTIRLDYINNLGLEALAILWMDDGGMNKEGNYGKLSLYTDRQQALEATEWIKRITSCEVNPQLYPEEEVFNLRVRTRDIPALHRLIAPYMLESMLYKLELTYSSNRMMKARRAMAGPPLLTSKENDSLERMSDTALTAFMKSKGFNYTKRGTKEERINRIRAESQIVD